MSELEELQRGFFRALQFPLRGTSRAATELAACEEGHAGEFLGIAEQIIKPGPSLSAAERLELYHRQYWFRILDSLAEDFPVLRRMAGEEMFWNMAEDYLIDRPSRSYTLRHLGEAFAPSIAASARLSDWQRLWFRAIAMVEYAHMESFEAAQGAYPGPEDLFWKRIHLQEHVKLLELEVAADRCTGWETFAVADHEVPGGVRLVVWREASGRSVQARVGDEEWPILQRLREPVRLEELFDALPEPVPSEAEITAMFGRWQTNGWLAVEGEMAEIALDPDAGWEGIDRMGSETRAMG